MKKLLAFLMISVMLIVGMTSNAFAIGAIGKVASYTTLLAGNGTYTGSYAGIEAFQQLTVQVNASQACTVYIDQSTDGTTIGSTTTLTVAAGVPQAKVIDVVGPLARMRVVNGSTIQTTFGLWLNGRVVANPTIDGASASLGTATAQTMTVSGLSTLGATTISGTATLSGLTASTPVALDASGHVVSDTTVVRDASGSHGYGAGHADWTLSATEALLTSIVVSGGDASANAILTSCQAGHTYHVYNNLDTGAAVLTFKVTGKSGGTIAKGKRAIYLCNGVDVIEIYEQP